MTGLKIIVGITGSIAAYKSAVLIRGLVKEGHEVRVIMTPSATQFISPLTLSTLSKNTVFTDINDGATWNNHVELGLWADLMLVAPISANTMAKMAAGICDNMLLATYLSAKCPVWIAPAMDLDMWKHPSTQANLKKLNTFDTLRILDVGEGELASGLFGPGRMAEPEDILNELSDWQKQNESLSGVKALVTAGPTYEFLDPVRFIGNPSSGKMGVCLANELSKRGAQVHLVLGPGSNHTLDTKISVSQVRSAKEMFEICQKEFTTSDLAIFAAAVADYTPKNPSNSKIKKADKNLILELERTTDIAGTLGDKKRERQTTIGFALETDEEESNAIGKLKRKNFNFVVLNSLKDKGAGFRLDTNKITIYDDENRTQAFDTKSKKEVAKDIIDYYCKHYKL